MEKREKTKLEKREKPKKPVKEEEVVCETQPKSYQRETKVKEEVEEKTIQITPTKTEVRLCAAWRV